MVNVNVVMLEIYGFELREGYWMDGSFVAVEVS